MPLILIRGGGDLASGVALRLFRSGFGVVISEVAEPLSVRRYASFSEAVYAGEWQVEGVSAVLCKSAADVAGSVESGKIAAVVDPFARITGDLAFLAVVDGRMLKHAESDSLYPGMFSIGLGPGFEVRINCDAVVESNRGAALGRVYWQGKAQMDTGEPETVEGVGSQRVIRAARNGRFVSIHEIGEIVDLGEVIARIDGEPVTAPFRGVIRGLLHSGTAVAQGLKIGDLDPRCDPGLCNRASDKALAVGGGVLEALLSRPKIRSALGRPGK